MESIFTKFLLAFFVFFADSVPLQASELTPSAIAVTDATLNSLLPVSRDEVLFNAVLAGVSDDDLKELESHLETVTPENAKRFKFTGKGLHFDSRPTGIRVTSLSPLNVTFKGNVWVYNKRLGLSENIKSLRSIFDARKSAQGLFDLLVSDAKAENAISDSVQQITSLAIAARAGFDGVASALGRAVGRVSVAAKSAVNAPVSRVQAIQRANFYVHILKHGVLTCNGSTFALKDKLGSHLTVDTSSVPPTLNGVLRNSFFSFTVNSERAPEHHIDNLYSHAGKCKNTQDALALQESLRAHARATRILAVAAVAAPRSQDHVKPQQAR